MNREEFLRQLEQLLSGISEEERADAMAFYRSYFEDAGAENEPLILEELESPQKVAESIMKNLGIDGSSGYYNTFANRDAEYYRNLRESVGSIGVGRHCRRDGRKLRFRNCAEGGCFRKRGACCSNSSDYGSALADGAAADSLGAPCGGRSAVRGGGVSCGSDGSSRGDRICTAGGGSRYAL